MWHFKSNNEIEKSIRATYKKLQIKKYVSSLRSREWQLKGDKLRVRSQECRVECEQPTNISRVTCQKCYVKSTMSRVIFQEWCVDSDTQSHVKILSFWQIFWLVITSYHKLWPVMVCYAMLWLLYMTSWLGLLFQIPYLTLDLMD